MKWLILYAKCLFTEVTLKEQQVPFSILALHIGGCSTNDTMALTKTTSNTMSHSNSSWVDSLAIIDHLGDVSVYIVGVVVDCLRAAVGEGDGVGSLPGGGAVVSLGG